MLGRSQNPDLISFNDELERIFRSRTPPITIAEETTKPMKEYFTSSTYTTVSCIRNPNTNASNYEIKSSIIQLLPLFYGLSNEEPINT